MEDIIPYPRSVPHDDTTDPGSTVDVLIQLLDPDVPVPAYAHPGDAGADLVTTQDVELPPGGRAMVPTGVAVALPDGYAAFVHPRSGLAARHGVTLVNAPGTVDAGYRGEIKVTLLNTDLHEPVKLARGDRVAQLVIQKVERARFLPAETLPGSARGAGGFGSSGGWAAARS
ncbi:dUTP diphosphatase [Myceligenerans pegani]|uniref:Deoxyuridine 5'-triphosphate nucleotidohydrolase n=1 Tax=Myceligenerans pegani TaxID=2776917 RepID=A0ABR9N0T7_9MICO|nr:dUTP diphosphatase [Myceligenerans sp. TRM 65318]MBE3019117.1 dUTP diphosphatase [Myceligenerans sp. TRM 65318]